jgi:hypothetical protein
MGRANGFDIMMLVVLFAARIGCDVKKIER